jgi:membrane protein
VSSSGGGGKAGLGQISLTLWTLARIPVAVLLLVFALALIYWLFPNVKQLFRFITPGAIIAVIVWIAVSLAFSFYVANLSSYSATYGALARSSCCSCTSLSRRRSCFSAAR